MTKRLVLAAWLAGALHGQTVINGDRRILGKWDASAATATVPFSVGTIASLPGSCVAGQMYFAADGPAGRNLYGCAGNEWRPVGHRQGTLAELPTSCATGELYFATDAAAGSNLYACGSPNVWSQINSGGGGGGGGAVASVFGRQGAVTAQSGDYTKAQVGLGNVDNTSDAAKPISMATQAALDGKLAAVAGSGVVKVTSGAPGVVGGTATDCVHVDGTSGACGGGAAVAPYTCAVPGVSSVVCTHNQGTTTPQVWCYEASGNLLGGDGASADVTAVAATSANVATITFSGTTTGTCKIGTGGQGPQGAAGAAGPAGPAGPAGVAAADLKVRTCEIAIGDPGAASAALANDNDSPAVCGNKTGSPLTITAVECYADAGSPTVTPIITGGAATSILSASLTCGTGSFAAGTLNGTPIESNGASIDANITTAGGTAKYIVIRITRTLQ